jgi:hypothetical protein
MGDSSMRAGRVVALAKGAATYIPFAYSLLGQKRMTTAGVTAYYCYRVWLKHMLLVDEISGRSVPSVVAELGPGDTIGVGIAALLSGACRYIGIDARRFMDADASASIAQEMVTLFRTRKPFPTTGCLEFRHLLDEQSFPSGLLDAGRMVECLSDERVTAVLAEMQAAMAGNASSMIAYRAPLSDPSVVDDNLVDLLISHSVLEHVVDLRQTLSNAFRWLKPGAFTSHLFDLTSHGIVSGWDEHRIFSDRAWKLIVGKRPFMINRLPYSAIIAIFGECGFRVLRADRMQMPTTLKRSSLSESWRAASDDDLSTYSGYVIAQKPE